MPEDIAREDGLLMHELTEVNTLLSKYVFRYLDADAGRADPVPTSEERILADRVEEAAERIRARAGRRERQGGPRHLFDSPPINEDQS